MNVAGQKALFCVKITFLLIHCKGCVNTRWSSPVNDSAVCSAICSVQSGGASRGSYLAMSDSWVQPSLDSTQPRHCALIEVSTHVGWFLTLLLLIKIVFVTRTDPGSIVVQIGSGGMYCF